MALAKIDSIKGTHLISESFRIIDDNLPIILGDTRLFRRHSPLLIYGFDVSVYRHDTGYPYGYENDPVRVRLISAPEQENSPYTNVPTKNNENPEAIVDPSSSSPLTARYQFEEPALISGGQSIGINTNCNDASNHFGLEVHIDYEILPIE
jgi:hypothetical protein